MEQSQNPVTACFTGHRIFSTPKDLLRLRLTLAITDLAEQGYQRFLSGMAMGFDLLAAETVLELKSRWALELVAVLPCPAELFTGAWPQGQKDRQKRLLEAADETVVVSPAYHEACMQQRNQYLVEHSSFVLACSERDHGGTAYTLSLARKQGLPVRNLAVVGQTP